MQDGKYEEKAGFPVEGTLHGDANGFYMDVECGVHGYHKYIWAGDTYNCGFKVPADPDFDFCLGLRSDGYTKDDREIYLEKTDPDKKQTWRLVGGDTFQYVATGEFLHAATMYPFVVNVDCPWERNHSPLVLRP